MTQALSSTGRSVIRFEVQKIVKGGSKTRLLILNIDIRVLMQANFLFVVVFWLLCSVVLLLLLLLFVLQLIIVP